MVTAFALPSRDDEVILDGSRLEIRDVVRVAREGARVTLSRSAEEAIERGQAALHTHVRNGARIYGLTTGVGALDGETLCPEENRAFQRNLLLSHAAGVGAPMPPAHVRAMLLARAHVLSRGRSGVRLPVVQALLAIVNRGVIPYVPEVGSVGASDLAALAHAALLLAGEGWAMMEGARIAGIVAMKAAGIPLPGLSGRDAFALINGPAQSAGTGALAVADACELADAADIAAAMSMVGAGSRTDFLDARLFEDERDASTRSARRMRELLGDETHGSRAVREPLSTRCAPMVSGAFHTAASRAHHAVTLELNRQVDNPSLLADGTLTNNSGLMHSAALAEALDALATSAIQLATMSERRVARLLDPAQNGGLPAFLVHPAAKAGLHSGMMIHQYTAAALIAELRAGCVPASIQSVPVGNGTEDHGSMSALCARRAAHALSLAKTVVAIELLTAAQAIDVRVASASRRPIPPAIDTALRALRARVPTLVEDRFAAADIDAALDVLPTCGMVADTCASTPPPPSSSPPFPS